MNQTVVVYLVEILFEFLSQNHSDPYSPDYYLVEVLAVCRAILGCMKVKTCH